MKATALLVAVLMTLAGRVRADHAPPFTIGSRPIWYVLGGVTTGGTVALADRGAFVGGELSVARLRDANHIGAYADGYYDWGADGWYVTGGLEAGRKLLGIDAGVAARFAADTDVGGTARVSLGLGLAALFARYAYFPSVGEMNEADHVIQVGLLLKLPFATLGDGQ